MNRIFERHRLAQGGGQLPPQPFAGHPQDVHAGLARGWFQVLAGAAVEVKYVAAFVHQRAGGGVLLQQSPLGQLVQWELAFPGRLPGGPWDGSFIREWWEKSPHSRAVRAVRILFALVQLRLPIHGGKEVHELAHGLGRAQEKHAARVQRVVQQGNQLLLQFRAHIDQHVAATDQVEFGKGRVLDDVLLGKDHQIADAFVDAVGAAVRLLEEKARQPVRRDVGGDTGRVNAGAGMSDGVAVNVGGEHLHFEILLQFLHALLQQDGDGIGFLAGGTAGHPDADGCAGRLAGEESRDDLFLERGERLRVPKETGDTDQEIAKERFHLARVLLQIADIPVQPLDLVDGHAPLDAADDGVPLVLGKVMTGLGAQQQEDLLQRVLGLGGWGRDRMGRLSERVGGVSDELGGHLGGRQHVIHQAGGDGAAGHAVILGGFGVLSHHHAALALDRPHPQGAVAARAREHDADGPLMLVQGQGAEEEVDRQTAEARCGRFQQLQRAVQKGHVPIGRDNVGAVGLHHHPVGDLEDLHAGIVLDQLGQDALVVRGQMLHQDKGHAGIGIGGHAGEKGLERRQPSGRGADTDNGKSFALGPGRRLGGGWFFRLVCLVL